ncbi:Hypothetical predicted protein [Olea europaea subsp. europaea]|uniref:Uncharacterized protein n=1 Tax=Olea europaea subsp. europaea TaxID=158383 RepID=A0A8S0TCG3_OLEEU|nr:Hypothetical predicted protein [Olea europaea subsp. europaea]
MDCSRTKIELSSSNTKSTTSDTEQHPTDIQEDDDPDFNDSNHDVYVDDDILFDCNVIEGIKMGMHIKPQDEDALKSDRSSNASSEEIKLGSGLDSDENISTHDFPEFFPQNEKRNPHLEIGLLFGVFEELKNVVRNYVVFN